MFSGSTFTKCNIKSPELLLNLAEYGCQASKEILIVRLARMALLRAQAEGFLCGKNKN